jgi:hypothetical protein
MKVREREKSDALERCYIEKTHLVRRKTEIRHMLLKTLPVVRWSHPPCREEKVCKW